MVTIPKAVRIIYNFLVQNNAKSLTGITGNVYWLNRPKDSELEDIVVNAISLNGSSLQEGSLNVNGHVPNLKLGNDDTQPDFKRLEQIAEILVDMLSDVYGYDYNFQVDEPGLMFPDYSGWFCNIKIKFWALRK